MLTPVLCACGCLQPMFSGDEWRDELLRNHSSARRIPDSPSYLVQDMGYKTSCWMWQGPKDSCGYGHLYITGSKTNCKAHRFAYELLIGPIRRTEVANDNI